MDYQAGKRDHQLQIISDHMDYDPMDPAYFFRGYDAMNSLERMALSMCRGRILDVGYGAGSHALILQKTQNEVYGVDVSPGAQIVARARGMREAWLNDFYNVSGTKFDTLLFLMNGLGIAGRFERFPRFLAKCRELLNPHGQVILDSSDLLYLFEDSDEMDRDDDTSDRWDDDTSNDTIESRDDDTLKKRDDDTFPSYYGNIRFQFIYNEIVGRPHDWLYLDYVSLEHLATSNGFSAERLMTAPDHSYLARLINLK